jgi:electron transfer flavoprotein beta subunit
MIAACLKWVDQRPEIDPLTGNVRVNPRTFGASPADLAALEWALRIGRGWGVDVVALTAGPPASEPVLREALATGAVRAVRADAALDAPSEVVAEALALALPDDVEVVVCGDRSIDRGSGAVAALLAARTGACQALGLVELTVGNAGDLRAARRLDRGRRELLRVTMPAVLSVEASTARLRRAPLSGVLAARDADVEVVARRAGAAASAVGPARTTAFRPRPRALPPPPSTLDARRRILALTGVLAERTRPTLVALDPAEAADLVLDQLKVWGYLP